MSDLDLTEAVDAAARVLYELRHPPDDECPCIPWEDTYQPGWREDVLPLVSAAAPFIAAWAAEAEREWWVSTIERLALGAHARSESGQPLLDLLALDKRRGGE